MLVKPNRLRYGDTVATVSPSNGWAGDTDVNWKYCLGTLRLKELFGLHTVSAPNSLRGSDYLNRNPQARAEDIMWAFTNSEVKAIIANIGGNDSINIIPFININIIKNNPKILIGYSDVQNIHVLCYKAGLSTFY
jgi:muramoyltetrapeptide carboxypeptidase LdcA involved in peptidoglycan recycling